MGLNILVVPLAIAIILYLVNKRSIMGDYRAGFWRNVFLIASLGLSIWLAAQKAPGYLDALLR